MRVLQSRSLVQARKDQSGLRCCRLCFAGPPLWPCLHLTPYNCKGLFLFFWLGGCCTVPCFKILSFSNQQSFIWVCHRKPVPVLLGGSAATSTSMIHSFFACDLTFLDGVLCEHTPACNTASSTDTPRDIQKDQHLPLKEWKRSATENPIFAACIVSCRHETYNLFACNLESIPTYFFQ